MYKEVRDLIISELKRDLIGPDYNQDDVLNEPPSQAYLTGILHPFDEEPIDEEELSDPFESNSPYNFNGDKYDSTFNESHELNETININNSTYKRQNSLGLKVYIKNNIKNIKVRIKWGEYLKRIKEKSEYFFEWTRNVIEHEFIVSLDKESYEMKLPKKGIIDEIYFYYSKKNIKESDISILSIFLINKNRGKSNEKALFQVNMQVFSEDKSDIFLSENVIKKDTDFNEYLYRNKPIFAKGFGCAAEWENNNNKYAYLVKTEFIPKYEIPSMSTQLQNDNEDEKVQENFFSIRKMGYSNNKDEIISKLEYLAFRYKKWIDSLAEKSSQDKEFTTNVINNCENAHKRMIEGINILKEDQKAYLAFLFMNKVMHTQNIMKNYSINSKHTTLEEELQKESLNWRPFQLAFILQNIKGIIDPKSEDRKIVDLLWFPTGGGKTEAYFGIMAFLMGYRRLTRDENENYDKDGGVTIILRYTLRLLTTQQRDRLMRLVVAAEYLRKKDEPLFGNSEFSIGFWVGDQVTANKFEDLKTDINKDIDEYKVRKEYKKIKKQILHCPCCGTSDLNYEFIPDSDVNTDKTGLEIYCSNKNCFYNNTHLPIYLIDEEIYRKTPTIIIATVDKFARLPWDEKTASIFGRVDRYCEKCGYISIGEWHQSRHNNPLKKVYKVKPFYPPELIVQDELHLITGPLGTLYGLYESAIEYLSITDEFNQVFVPKYIAATATIKNADEQIRRIFGRSETRQFPPFGLSVEDSFFAKEIDVEEYPFRLYTGVSVSGHSVKTVLLRVYAVLLQVTETILSEPKYRKYIDYIDPYRTLIGYFNSIRELGGAVRLLDDDVKKRIQTLCNKYGYKKQRYIDRKKEITSRITSDNIPKILKLLEKETGNNELDVVLATNMISVGMDVDRLGLMVVTGQPKQTSEYIQATSRVGRNKPGLVITVYNPYRPRDLSHYENFVGYHSRLYNFVEGTSVTPFATRARDRALHAAIVAMIRLNIKELAKNEDAINIKNVNTNEIKEFIKSRVSIADVKNLYDTLSDFDYFLDNWKKMSLTEKKFNYYFYPNKKNLQNSEKRLLSRYNDRQPKDKSEWDTLDSLRNIEASSKLFLYEGWFSNA